MPLPSDLHAVRNHLTEASAILGRLVASGDTRYGINDAFTLSLDALSQVSHELRAVADADLDAAARAAREVA